MPFFKVWLNENGYHADKLNCSLWGICFCLPKWLRKQENALRVKTESYFLEQKNHGAEKWGVLWSSKKTSLGLKVAFRDKFLGQKASITFWKQIFSNLSASQFICRGDVSEHIARWRKKKQERPREFFLTWIDKVLKESHSLQKHKTDLSCKEETISQPSIFSLESEYICTFKIFYLLHYYHP